MCMTEFFMWWLYYHERPFGDLRQDLQFALLGKSLLTPYSTADIALEKFMLFPPEWMKEKLPTPEELAAKCEALFGKK